MTTSTKPVTSTIESVSVIGYRTVAGVRISTTVAPVTIAALIATTRAYSEVRR